MAWPEDERNALLATLGERYTSRFIGVSRDGPELVALYIDALAEYVKLCETDLTGAQTEDVATQEATEFVDEHFERQLVDNDRKRSEIVGFVTASRTEEAALHDLLKSANDAIESIERKREGALRDRLRSINTMVAVWAEFVPEILRLRTRYGQADVRIENGQLVITVGVKDHEDMEEA